MGGSRAVPQCLAEDVNERTAETGHGAPCTGLWWCLNSFGIQIYMQTITVGHQLQ